MDFWSREGWKEKRKWERVKEKRKRGRVKEQRCPKCFFPPGIWTTHPLRFSVSALLLSAFPRCPLSSLGFLMLSFCSQCWFLSRSSPALLSTFLPCLPASLLTSVPVLASNSTSPHDTQVHPTQNHTRNYRTASSLHFRNHLIEPSSLGNWGSERYIICPMSQN